MFFLQQLGYLVFLQVSSTLFSIFSVPRVAWAYFCFSLRLLLLALSYMYFILIGPFCFGLFVFHSALGANILFGTKYFCLYIRSGTVRLQEPALFPKHVIVIAVRDRSAPEPVLFRNELFSVYSPGPFGCESQVLFKNKHWCMWSETVWLWDPVLCLKRIFCWFVSGSRFFLLFGVKYYCMRSWPAGLRDPVLVIYTVRDRFTLGAGEIFAKDYCYTA